MTGSENNGIEVRGLVKQFKGSIRAVDAIDIDVAPGEIYGFLGPNGAGKSTTVNMLVTLLPPTSGHARVAGWDIATQGPQVRATIGAALQAVALDNFLTAREHLKLIASLQGITGARATSRAKELLERVGLEEAADRKVGGFSGGMKRRLDLALALVHEPRVLFLDEPTTGLDPQSRSSLWEEVRRLAREDGVTVFLTTQYLEEADVLADRVGIINSGVIVAEGTPAALKAEIGAPTVEIVPVHDADAAAIADVLGRFGQLQSESPAAGPGSVAVRLERGAERASLVTLVRAIDDAGLDIAEIRQHEPSLDDVFLAKTGRTLEGASGETDVDGSTDTPESTSGTRAAEPVA
ncbi:MAG: ATP-binding cassette domain-containing protein [Thermoleophilia bacterium]|nr:ATP-binding cassette domain-containing protein [Thermoleophilia bacterium]